MSVFKNRYGNPISTANLRKLTKSFINVLERVGVGLFLVLFLSNPTEEVSTDEASAEKPDIRVVASNNVDKTNLL